MNKKAAVIIDVLNAILGIAIIALVIPLLRDVRRHLLFFPVIFMIATIMNSLEGYKRLKKGKRETGVPLIISAVAFAVVSVTCIILFI